MRHPCPFIARFRKYMARHAVAAALCVAAALALLPTTKRTRTPSLNLLSAKKTVWTFEEAREYARSFGFGSQAEYVEYRCPGAYALPRDPVAAFGDRWTSWRVAASFYIVWVLRHRCDVPHSKRAQGGLPWTRRSRDAAGLRAGAVRRDGLGRRPARPERHQGVRARGTQRHRANTVWKSNFGRPPTPSTRCVETKLTG